MRLIAAITIALWLLVTPLSAQLSSEQDAVMRVDEEFRLAKLHNDTATLSRILAENYYGTNQNGNSRNKEQLISLFTTFPIKSLVTDSFEVRITGNAAVVTGSQSEGNAGGVDRMLFMRVYLKTPNGWQLLSSMQSRKP
ncbi:MAG TPA: nuclear transport factor 2 family protein [Bryobacteraceae bacterium]|nr:nuclear transport factor 2 family protein [Bryobacteraceae bacterium]